MALDVQTGGWESFACIGGLQASTSYEVRASSTAAVPAAIQVRVVVAGHRRSDVLRSRQTLDTAKAFTRTDADGVPVCDGRGTVCHDPEALARQRLHKGSCAAWVAGSALGEGAAG